MRFLFGHGEGGARGTCGLDNHRNISRTIISTVTIVDPKIEVGIGRDIAEQQRCHGAGGLSCLETTRVLVRSSQRVESNPGRTAR